MSEMGLENKGTWQPSGGTPDKIDGGMPTGGAPGDGELAPFPVPGGVFGANSNAPIK